MRQTTFAGLRNALDGGAPMPSAIIDTLHVYMTDYNSLFICGDDGHVPDGWTLLFTSPIELDIPPLSREDIVEKQVEGLEKVKRQIMGEAQAKIENIDLTIQNLRALEYKPEAGA